MSLVVSAVVFGLTMLVGDICCGLTPATARLTCGQLPKVEVPNIETLKAHAPFRYDYTLTTLWECTTLEYSRPPRGITSHHGTVLTMQGTALHALEYIVDSDKKTLYMTSCSNGEKLVFYMSAAHFDENGGFLCVYACNNTTLQEYACISNNNRATPAESEAVELARQVPNGHLIHDGWAKCQARKACNNY